MNFFMFYMNPFAQMYGMHVAVSVALSFMITPLHASVELPSHAVGPQKFPRMKIKNVEGNVVYLERSIRLCS